MRTLSWRSSHDEVQLHLHEWLNSIKRISSWWSSICHDSIMFTTIIQQEYLDYKKQRGEMMIERTNSLLLPFAFWGDPPKREPGNLYELRSYHLRVSVVWVSPLIPSPLPTPIIERTNSLLLPLAFGVIRQRESQAISMNLGVII